MVLQPQFLLIKLVEMVILMVHNLMATITLLIFLKKLMTAMFCLLPHLVLLSAMGKDKTEVLSNVTAMLKAETSLILTGELKTVLLSILKTTSIINHKHHSTITGLLMTSPHYQLQFMPLGVLEVVVELLGTTEIYSMFV